MLRTKLGYIEKVRMALHLDIGVVFKLMMAGGILVGVFTPIFFEEMQWRAAMTLAGGVVMLMIGLPVTCMQRLRKMDEEHGEGVADAYVAWKRTAKKHDYMDMDVLARKIKEEKEGKPAQSAGAPLNDDTPADQP